MLNLPRFTFLIDSVMNKASRLELAKAMVYDDNAGEIRELDTPLRMAAQGMFVGNVDHGLDYASETCLDDILLDPSPVTVRDYLIHSWILMTNLFGESILGRLALEEMERDGVLELGIDHTIFPDTHNFYEALPFVERWGPMRCLFIRLGSIGDLPNGPGGNLIANCKHIWIPVEGTTQRLAYLEKELRDVR